MENASRALFIVVGVFLGLLLLSVMIYVFRQGARVNATYDQKQITNQLELYNARFEEFDRGNNNIIDVISLCNLAFDVNMASEYDSQNAVEVEIVIGNKTFKIPNTYCNICKDNTRADLKGKKCCGKDIFVNRNTILDESNKQLSIYNLANMSLTKYNVSSAPPQEWTFFPERFKPANPAGKDKPPAVSADFTNDTLSTTKLNANGKTIYKYLFARVNLEDLQYHEINMKISKIKLTAYCNSEWSE